MTNMSLAAWHSTPTGRLNDLRNSYHLVNTGDSNRGNEMTNRPTTEYMIEGATAQANHQPLSDCPYCGPKAKEWQYGWNSALNAAIDALWAKQAVASAAA